MQRKKDIFSERERLKMEKIERKKIIKIKINMHGIRLSL